MDEKKAVDSGALEYFHDKLKGEFSTPAQAKDIAKESVYFVPASSANALAGSVSLTLPVPAIQGANVRFVSPLASGDITVGVTIDGVQYQWRDVDGNNIAGLADVFDAGAVVDISVDREGVVAYFIGATPVPPIIAYPENAPPAQRIPGRMYSRVIADFASDNFWE